MSYRDIGQRLKIYMPFSVSTATISAITDKVIPDKAVAAAPAGEGLSLRLAGRHSL